MARDWSSDVCSSDLGVRKCRYIVDAGFEICMTSESSVSMFLSGMANVTRMGRSLGAAPRSLYPWMGGATAGEVEVATMTGSDVITGKTRRNARRDAKTLLSASFGFPDKRQNKNGKETCE
jgi:hypothetical protein